MKKVAYLNKEILNCVNKRSVAKGYNRTVPQSFVDQLPERVNFPVVMIMPHEHADGLPVETHVRCGIMTGQSLTGPFKLILLDIEMEMFEALPFKTIDINTENVSQKRSKIPSASNN